MKRNLVMLAVMAMAILLAVGSGYAASYPEDVMKKIDEIKELEKNKKDMPESLAGIGVVKGEEAHKLKAKGAKAVDNRIKAQYDTEHIEGALLLTVDELLKNPSLADKLGKDDDLILYCNGVKCWRSPAAAVILQHLGFKKIHWYRDGIPDWKKRGYPTE